MARRKKGINYNLILVCLALIIGTWVAADYYFNVYRHSQKEPASVPVATVPVSEKKDQPLAKEQPAVVADGFKSETYRDDRYGIEFQYPVAIKDDGQCPKFEKTGDGFSLGIFSFLASDKNGNMDDFINSELQGMAIDDKKTVTVGGRAAIKADYQTGGMGWYGSSTFVENNNKFFEFGLLANESSAKCGGADDYEDQVYQSVISTLKFVD